MSSGQQVGRRVNPQIGGDGSSVLVTATGSPTARTLAEWEATGPLTLTATEGDRQATLAGAFSNGSPSAVVPRVLITDGTGALPSNLDWNNYLFLVTNVRGFHRPVFAINDYGGVKIWDYLIIAPYQNGTTPASGTMFGVASDLGPAGTSVAITNGNPSGTALHDFIQINSWTGATFDLGTRRFTFTDGGLLVFGPKVAGTAALKNMGGTLAARQGDDSGYTYFQAAGLVGDFLLGIAGQAVRVEGQVPTGASSIGVKIGNTASLTSAGAKIAAFYSDSQTTEKGAVGKDGDWKTTANSFLDDSTNTGNRTVNLPHGISAFAGGTAAVTITNSLVTATSRVFVTIQTNDATAILKNVVPGSGTFTVNLTANATGTTKFGWMVVN